MSIIELMPKGASGNKGEPSEMSINLLSIPGNEQLLTQSQKQFVQETIPSIRLYSDGQDMKIDAELVMTGLSAISVKHDAPSECQKDACQTDSLCAPAGIIKHRNSFRNIFRPDVKRIPYLQKLTQHELEQFIRRHISSDNTSLDVIKKKSGSFANVVISSEECMNVLLPAANNVTKINSETSGSNASNEGKYIHVNASEVMSDFEGMPSLTLIQQRTVDLPDWDICPGLVPHRNRKELALDLATYDHGESVEFLSSCDNLTEQLEDAFMWQKSSLEVGMHKELCKIPECSMPTPGGTSDVPSTMKLHVSPGRVYAVDEPAARQPGDIGDATSGGERTPDWRRVTCHSATTQGRGDILKNQK